MTQVIASFLYVAVGHILYGPNHHTKWCGYLNLDNDLLGYAVAARRSLLIFLSGDE